MSYKCPYCQNQLALMENNAFKNCDIYGGTNTVITECCHQLVRISRSTTFHVNKTTIEPDKNGLISDDWGNEIQVMKPEPELHVEGGQIWINQSGCPHLMTGRWFEEGVYYCLISLGTGRHHCIWTDSVGMQGLLKDEKWRLKK